MGKTNHLPTHTSPRFPHRHHLSSPLHGGSNWQIDSRGGHFICDSDTSMPMRAVSFASAFVGGPSAEINSASLLPQPPFKSASKHPAGPTTAGSSSSKKKKRRDVPSFNEDDEEDVDNDQEKDYKEFD